jgi:hypothetical protein
MLANHQKFIARFVVPISGMLEQNFNTTRIVKDSKKQMKGLLPNTVFLLELLPKKRRCLSKLRFNMKEVHLRVQFQK